MNDLCFWPDAVREFHETYECQIADKPHVNVDQAVIKLRENILDEEVEELSVAMHTANIVEIGDAIVDCIYILIGTAHVYGIGDILNSLFAEVHRSNMSKLDENGKPIFREDGKVLKGPHYFKPNLKDIILNA